MTAYFELLSHTKESVKLGIQGWRKALSPPGSNRPGMQRAMSAGIYDLGLFVIAPVQVLAAAAAEAHEFPFHGHAASGADVVAAAIGEAHDCRYRQLYPVA